MRLIMRVMGCKKLVGTVQNLNAARRSIPHLSSTLQPMINFSSRNSPHHTYKYFNKVTDATRLVTLTKLSVGCSVYIEV
jgi:hypothetical protein